MHPNHQLLGVVPSLTEEQQVVDHFLYVFEFTFSSAAFLEVREDMKGWLETELTNVCGDCKLSPKKEWWAYCLLVLRRIAEENEGPYGVQATNRFLMRIDSLSEADLMRSANLLALAFSDEFFDTIFIRPQELAALKSSYLRTDVLIKILLPQMDEITAILRRYLPQHAFDKGYLQNVWLPELMKNKKDDEFYVPMMETFLFHMIHELVAEDWRSEEFLDGTFVEYLKESMLAFFILTIEHSMVQVDKMIDELLPLFIGFVEVEESREWLVQKASITHH